MKKVTVFAVCIVALLLSLSGCFAIYYVKPPLRQLEQKDLAPDIRTTHPVAIIPAYISSTEPIHICQDSFFDYFAQRDELTDSAVKNLEAIFKQKNITVNAAAEKKLKIAVLHVRCSSTPASAVTYHVTLRVQAGDNIVMDFTGFNIGGTIDVATNVSQAINEAYLRMFNNEEIKRYLEN